MIPRKPWASWFPISRPDIITAKLNDFGPVYLYGEPSIETYGDWPTGDDHIAYYEAGTEIPTVEYDQP